jgi:hypothetical protein
MKNPNCYIEFEIQEPNAFVALKNIFDLIKKAKNTGQPQTDEFWLTHFPAYSLKYFYFLENEKKPSFQTAAQSQFTWHFYSLANLLQTDYEIEYTDCLKLSNDLGRLEYLPYAYPYGGISGLITLITSFNCKPLVIDDGTSLYRIEFERNGDFSITDLNDPERQNSSDRRFDATDLLKKFSNRFK